MKKCLLLKASAAACASEVETISRTLKNLGIEMRELEWLSPEDFRQQIGENDKYDLIYLGAHADGYGFGESQDSAMHRWEDLADVLCTTNCMVPNGTLFLGCCRGGMKTVALKILLSCEKIDYICGPNWNSHGSKLMTAFHAFVECRIRTNEEPAVAAKRASEATGQLFSCYDRQELESEIETLRQIRHIEWEVRYLHAGQNAILEQITALAKGLNVKLPEPAYIPLPSPNPNEDHAPQTLV